MYKIVCYSTEWLLTHTQDQWLRGGEVPRQDERAHAPTAGLQQPVQQQGKEDVVRAAMSTCHTLPVAVVAHESVRLVCFGSFLSSLFACCYEQILIWSDVATMATTTVCNDVSWSLAARVTNCCHVSLCSVQSND